MVSTIAPQLCFKCFLRSHDRSFEPYPLVCSFVLLFCLVQCSFLSCACLACFLYVCREQKGTQFESCEDEEMQEQELKNLSSYYLDLRQVCSLIIFCPNNIYFTLAFIKLIDTYYPYCFSMSLNSRVTFIKSFAQLAQLLNNGYGWFMKTILET